MGSGERVVEHAGFDEAEDDNTLYYDLASGHGLDDHAVFDEPDDYDTLYDELECFPDPW
jgi:hypothetical protein